MPVFSCGEGLEEGKAGASGPVETTGLSPEVARQEQTEPVDSSDQVKLADAWWKLAQTAKGKDRADFLARARSWYRAALPNLAGITETRVAQRLEELDAQDVARNRGR